MKSIIFSIFLTLVFCFSHHSIASAEEMNDEKDWSHHFQTTTVTQTHFKFNAPYSGENSLKNTFEKPTSLTATIYVGHRLWSNAFIFVNPEEQMGEGLSLSRGIAAYPNGEIYRVDSPKPAINLSRFYIQQDFELGGEKEKVEDDINQFERLRDVNHLTFVLGKFSLNDYLDDNSYSHDPRSQFLNWTLMDIGAWDYAADTRGYTWGLMTEYHLPKWSIRFAVVEVPLSANGLEMDGNITQANAENLEIEYRYHLDSHPGKIRTLFFMNHAHMGNYREAISLALSQGTLPDITQTRSYSLKYGVGLNVEQEITNELGVFTRLGWNDGKTETWAFTEIDQSLSLGLSLKGNSWHRTDDVAGLALNIDGLSQDHQDYLKAGGLGFIIGDRHLNYAPEEVLEAYYLYKIIKSASLTLDIQAVNHPAFNSDRGPVALYGLRMHYEI